MTEFETNFLQKMTLLIKLTAANILQGKSFYEQIELLDFVGMQPKEIADMLQKTPNHVRVALTHIRKKNLK